MHLSYSFKVNYNIEKKARAMGMIYPEEVRVINEETGE